MTDQQPAADPRALLRGQFGYEAFRPGQERAIRALLAGRDALAILPTGAGKSLIYQLTSQLLPGVTLVVSPLLALMQDQLDSLAELGIAATVINSLQSDTESQQALEDVRAGRSKLLFVAPERFDDPDFMAGAARLAFSLFVVDEAHSISEWGHSFRPAYLGLAAAATTLRRPTLLALTATATPWVRRDIIDNLELRDPVVVVRGTDRPNLFLAAEHVEEETEDRRVLQRLLVADEASVHRGSGIVYCATTRGAEETAAWLTDWGISADYYHGRRRKSDRLHVQDAFMAGEVRVIAATNAFGLGVDKPDVRFVIHRDSPASVESYYQEAGRAGRDGEPARCTLIFRPADLGRAAFLASTGKLTIEDVVRVRQALLALDGSAVTLAELRSASRVGRADLARLMALLVDAGVVDQRRNRVRLRVADFDPESVPLEREERRLAYERSRLEMMRAYAELRTCRRAYILNYFGEQPEWERCGNCDVDLEHPAVSGTTTNNHAFSIGERVVHPSLGGGAVQRVTEDTVVVLFDAAGYKTLDLSLVHEQKLLHRAEVS